MAVTIQDDFWAAAQYMPDDQAREFVYALVRFGITGEEPDPSEPWYPTFVACRGRVELSQAKQSKARRMSEARWGRRGAQDDAGEDEAEPQEAHDRDQASCTDADKHDAQDAPSMMHDRDQASCTDAPVHRPEKESEKESEKEKEKEVKRKRAAKAARFSPPSPEDVRAYAEGRGLAIDPSAFVDFYAAKGWRVGTSPMRDWKAAVRNWCRRDERPRQGRGAPPRGSVSDEYAQL